MNDNELEQILNEIKNNKNKPKKELDSDEFEDILNSLHSHDEEDDVVEESEENTLEQTDFEKVAKPEEKTESTSESTVQPESDSDEFHLVSNDTAVDDEDDFKPVNDIDDGNVYFSEMAEQVNDKKPKKKGKIIAVILVVLALVVAIAVGVYFYFFNGNKQDDTTTQTKPKVTETVTQKSELGPLNPLTGETGYDENALTQRPVAVVVENEYSTSSVRPQWGLADADIVLEGESEFSTRMLLFWADYNKVPEQVGPARSARPPFIHFSQLFDAVFIHAGLSHSKDNYVGADEVFESENIDHINLLSFSESGSYFRRDKSRTSTIEHTGCLWVPILPICLKIQRLI